MAKSAGRAQKATNAAPGGVNVLQDLGVYESGNNTGNIAGGVVATSGEQLNNIYENLTGQYGNDPSTRGELERGLKALYSIAPESADVGLTKPALRNTANLLFQIQL